MVVEQIDSYRVTAKPIVKGCVRTSEEMPSNQRMWSLNTPVVSKSTSTASQLLLHPSVSHHVSLLVVSQN
jgi:hypothetical protein